MLPGLVNAAEIAQRLAAALAVISQPYAIGGALALGYWGVPRGTNDVDITLFLPPDEPDKCISCLQQIGCDLWAADVRTSLVEHGFCRVAFSGVRVDVFLPSVDFYESARQRRREVYLGNQLIWIWDAESLAVFKMMFFRRKDIADVEQILRTQSAGSFEHDWVREHLISIHGRRDPRVAQWDELVDELS